jgi:hypothetical protein
MQFFSEAGLLGRLRLLGVNSLNAAIALVLVLVLSPAVLSQTAQTQDTKSDIPKLQAMAEGGDASAQLSLGLAYQNGRGVQQNDSIAVEWYRKAAQGGVSQAQRLGVMYMNGWRREGQSRGAPLVSLGGEAKECSRNV